MTEAYRLLRVKDGRPHTLFHGYHGTRALTQDRLLRAVKRHVWNPGKKGKSPGFTSGWHVLLTKKACEEYLKKFTAKDDIVVCKVLVRCYQEKPRSKVLLADFMEIRSVDWARAMKEYGYALA